MASWEEIINHPEFSNLSQSQQVAVRDGWFQSFVAPAMQKEGIRDVIIEQERQSALEKFDNGQGYVSSFLSSAGRGLATTATGIVTGAGTLIGSDELEQTGRGLTESVNEALPINTSLEKTNFVGNVAGNIGGFMAAGGAGGFIGKGLGGVAKGTQFASATEAILAAKKASDAAKLGAEIGSLGTTFLGGAGSGAQEADQYQIAGPERYLRALGGGLTEVLTEKLPLTGGMGTELRAISRIPGLSAVAGKRTGGFIKDVYGETVEETTSQIAGNALTTALAPTGVETPGLLSGTPGAAAGGALGGLGFGGINLIRTPSERISDTSIAAAEAAGDTAQANVLAEAKANAATLSPRLVPVEAPTLTEIAPPDSTLNDPLSPTPVEDLPPPPGFETPLPELLEPIAPTPVEETPAEAPITEAPITEAPITEAPIAEAPIAEAPVAEPVTPPATREEALTAKAEEVFPTPELPAEQQARLEEESRLIDKHGRISQDEAIRMVDAVRELGASTLPVVINDTGFNGTNGQYRGSIQTVNGQPTVFINRNMVNADTPIHEVIGHGVLPNLRESNPDLFQQGAQLLQGSPLMEAVRSRYTEAGVALDDTGLLEEVMATAYGNDSATFWRQYAGNAKLVRAIKQWLAKVRVWVEDRLASKGIDPNMTVGQFNEKVTRRILAGQLREAARTEAPSQPTAPNEIQTSDAQEDGQENPQGQGEELLTPPPVQEPAPDAPAPISPDQGPVPELPDPVAESARLDDLTEDASLEQVVRAAPMAVQMAISVYQAGQSFAEWSKNAVQAAGKSISRFLSVIWRNLRLAMIGLVAGSTGLNYQQVSSLGSDLPAVATVAPVQGFFDTPAASIFDGTETGPIQQEPVQRTGTKRPSSRRSPAALAAKTTEAIQEEDDGEATVFLSAGIQKDWVDSVQQTPAIRQAVEFMGQQEGNNKLLARIFNHFGIRESQDTYPWCAAFTSFCLTKAGSPSKILNARGFLGVGRDTTKTPAVGDVVVFWNNNPDTGGKTGWGGHVGIYLGETATHIINISGNANDEVGVTAIPKQRLLGARRLPTEGQLSFSEPASDDTRFSLPAPKTNAARIDAEYMAAVESGDVQRQHELVYKSAEAAGFDLSHREPRNSVNWRERKDVVQFVKWNATETAKNFGYGDAEYLIKSSELKPVPDFVIEWVSENNQDVINYAEMEGIDPREAAEQSLNPVDIVNDAGFWDDRNAVRQLYAELGDRMGVGFLTPDGAVIFDPYTAAENGMAVSADPITRDDAGNVIPLSQRFKPASDDIRFSLPAPKTNAARIDAEYMDAVESGDVQRQQGLVDAAAKAAGDKVGEVYHATQADNKKFTKFDPEKGGREGFHFGSRNAALDRISDVTGTANDRERLRSFRLIGEVIDIEDSGSTNGAVEVAAQLESAGRISLRQWATVNAADKKRRAKDATDPEVAQEYKDDAARKEKEIGRPLKTPEQELVDITGQAVFRYKNIVEGGGEYSYVVFDPSQIKSADPVTRDDAGNVIPLSQRFKPASDDIRFSLPPPGDLKPSGLSANQRGPVRNLVAGIMYESETMEAAFDEAEAIYTRNKDFTFDQHFAALNEMFNAPIGTTLNMTPGAYWGLLSRSLTEMERNEDLPASERDAARRNNDRLAAMVAPIVAAGGQRIKGIDGGLKLANNPRMVVDLHDRLTPFDGSETRRNRFDAEKAAVTSVLDQVTLEELGKMAETALQGTLAAGLSDQIRGEHSADEGVATANEALEPAAEEAETADFSWLQRAVDSLGAELQTTITEQLEWLQVIDLLSQEGEFSLDPTAVRNAAAKRIADMRAQGMNKAAIMAAAQAGLAATTAKITSLKAKKPVAGTTQPQDLKGMVIGRLTEALDKLMTPASKKRKNAPTQEQIAAAISSAILAKSGLGPFPKGVSGDMALALGLLLKNQATAAEAIQDIHSALQLDPRTQDSITKEKLKAFMQLAIGKTFDTASGASEQATPYGEKQIATVLRGEMKRLETSIREVAMDASLQRQTAAKLEAALRSPERGLDKILSPEALDATVSAVVAEFNKTAAQRAADMQRQQAEESVRTRMKEDQRQQKAQEELEIRQAKRDAELAQKEVQAAMAAEKKAEEQWQQELADQERRNKTIAEREVRDAMNREAKAAAKWKEEQLRSAKKAVLDTMRAYKTAKAKQEAAQARADKRETEAAIREAAAEAKNKKAAAVRAMRNKRKAARAEIRKAKGLPEPLNFEEKQRLLGVKQEKIIDYLAREFGFDLTEIVAMARQEDRAASVQAMTLRLADALGLNPEQAEMFMKPVMAEAMKNIDAKRQKEVERRINDAIKRAGKRAERAKKVNQPTEAQKLVRLAMLGGLSAKNVEKLMLNDMGAEAFSDEFRAELERMIEKANDPNLPASSRAELTALYLQMIKSARGASALGLAGEWIMSNIFMAMNTFKVNLVWGGAKSFLDSAIYASTTAQAAVNPGGPRLPGLSKAVAKQAARTFARDLQYQAAYILKTGKSPLTNDKLTQFSQSEMELITTMPQTEIRAWISGKPLSPAWQNSAKALSKLSRYTRRIMVSTDLLWRAQAYEMLKATAVAKVIVERGGEIPRNAKEWSKAIDDALYGGDFEQAKEDAYRQVDNEIASGAVPPEQRGIRFGEILDGKLGDSLGIDPDQRATILNEASEEAKRWTVANETEGILGVLSNTVLAAVRDVPGLKFLLPAIRMPIGAFSQTLDWTPYGFARAQAIKWNEGRSSSVTNAIWNREGIKKSWPLPAHGVPSERAVDLRTKALLGSSMMLTMFIMALMDLDEDEDKADFYITGKGPENPQENKLWREKGNRPFMVRAGGVSFNYQESPIYAPLSIIGAWSDTQRYGKMDDTQSDKFAYLIQKVMTGFGEAAVLRNMQEALGSFTGGGSYTSSGAVDAAGKWTARTAGVLLFPRVGSEINTILFGPQDQKQIGWAGRALANVPFTPALFDKPALNFFGESIHTVRGDAWGEVAPILAHRISPVLTDDPQMQFVAKMKANPLSTTRRFTDGTQVMDDYDFIRLWAADSGKAIRAWLTPERMAAIERIRATDPEKATEVFDAELRRIRAESLQKLGKGRIQF